MKRVGYFLLLLLAALAVLLPTVAWYLAGYQSGAATVTGMMGQMMGNRLAYGMTAPMPSYVWALFAALFVLAVGGVAGLGYYLAYPEIKTTTTPTQPPEKAQEESESPKVDWSVLLRTSKPEERRVLEVLASHDGKYLQKFIVKESSLSRLRTHRIVSRFAERGIVLVSKSGNTNEVSLAPWLKADSKKGAS